MRLEWNDDYSEDFPRSVAWFKHYVIKVEVSAEYAPDGAPRLLVGRVLILSGGDVEAQFRVSKYFEASPWFDDDGRFADYTLEEAKDYAQTFFNGLVAEGA